jgi:hypothetical protein
MAELCRELESENTSQRREMEKLREQLSEARSRAASVDLIPEYREAVAAARSHVQVLRKRLETADDANCRLQKRLDVISANAEAGVLHRDAGTAQHDEVADVAASHARMADAKLRVVPSLLPTKRPVKRAVMSEANNTTAQVAAAQDAAATKRPEVSAAPLREATPTSKAMTVDNAGATATLPGVAHARRLLADADELVRKMAKPAVASSLAAPLNEWIERNTPTKSRPAEIDERAEALPAQRPTLQICKARLRPRDSPTVSQRKNNETAAVLEANAAVLATLSELLVPPRSPEILRHRSRRRRQRKSDLPTNAGHKKSAIAARAGAAAASFVLKHSGLKAGPLPQLHAPESQLSHSEPEWVNYDEFGNAVTPPRQGNPTDVTVVVDRSHKQRP